MCGVDLHVIHLLKVPVHKILYCFTAFVEFVKRTIVIRSGFDAFRGDSAQTLPLCKLTQGFSSISLRYHSVQNLLSSRLLSKNLKIKIYRTIILPVVSYGCETWSLTLRGERKLRVFENMVSRRIFGPRRDEVTGNGGDCITRS